MEYSEYIKDLTSKQVSEKAMKTRCLDCQQTESYLSDSVYYGDGDCSVEELIEFRKQGFITVGNVKCPCFIPQK